MTKSIVRAALAGLLLAGCSKTPAVAPPPARTFVWDSQSRPYRVIGVGGSNVPRIGDQARMAQVVYPSPENRAEVEAALHEIYTELKQDVEKVQADAKYRRIMISIYEVEKDIQHDPRAWLCWLEVSPDPGEPLPEDPSDFVQWQWRDPQARPTQRERKIEWDYLAKLEKVNLATEFPITDGELIGKNAAERRAFIEKRYQGDADHIKEQLASTHGMSVDELQQLLDRIMEWKYREETVESEDSLAESDLQPEPVASESSDGSAGN